MSKNNSKYVEELKEARSFINKVRTINEAMTFDEDYDDDSIYGDEKEDVENTRPIESEPVCMDGECDSDLPNAIDNIRDIALKGILKHVKNSTSPEYETLKKNFQFCDKVNNEKPEGQE